MVYILLCLATAATYSYKPHSMACVVNMDISVPPSTTNAVNINAYCNNGHCASKFIVFGYSWMRRCPTPWTQQQFVPLMKSLSHSLKPSTKEYVPTSLLTSVLAMYYSGMLQILPLAIMVVIAPRVCNTTVQLKQHVPCQQLYLRKHGFLQHMKCLLKKQQVYTGHILTPTLINAWECYWSGQQHCKSPTNHWKISAI